MRATGSLFSSIGFIAAGATMSLPFVTIRTNGFLHAELEWRGYQLTIGDTPKNWLTTAEGKRISIDETPSPEAFIAGQPEFIIAALLMLAGVLAALLIGQRPQAMLSAVAGIGGALALVLGERHVLALLTDRWPDAVDFGAMDLAPAPGFWITTTLLATLGLANVARYLTAAKPVLTR